MLSSALFVWRVFHFVLVHLTGQRFRHQQSVRRLAIYVSSSAAFAGPRVLVLSTDKEIGQGALHSLRTVHLLLYHISMPCNNLHTHWKSAPIYHICRSGILWGQPTFGLFSLDRHVIMNPERLWDVWHSTIEQLNLLLLWRILQWPLQTIFVLETFADLAGCRWWGKSV